jgi:chromosome segregation ATPase
MVSLVAILIMVVAWGPSPTGAVSAEYQRALAEYNQATAEVNAAQAKLDQAQAKLAPAQTAYNQADALYQQIQGKVQALTRKVDSLKKQIERKQAQFDSEETGVITWNEERSRILHEIYQLMFEKYRVWDVKDNLSRALRYREGLRDDAKSALEAAQKEVREAQAELAQAKQRQAAALRALNLAMDRGKRRVVQSVSTGPALASPRTE